MTDAEQPAEGAEDADSEQTAGGGESGGRQECCPAGEHLFSTAAYALIGLLLEAEKLIPKLVVQGRRHAEGARLLGQAAMREAAARCAAATQKARTAADDPAPAQQPDAAADDKTTREADPADEAADG